MVHLLIITRTQFAVFILVGLSEGLSEIIRTQDPVMALVGQEARFTCQLTQSKNVLQVTWQKITPGGTEDVATCSKRFGTKINPPFQGKVEFVDTGLQNSAIVLKNVTKADKCCYRCLFNAYPEGAIYTKTCLTVYEQPELTLRVTKSNGTEKMAVSCSAVSHPAPTVTLEVPRHEGSSNYSSVHAANADGTVTVNSTVTLERFCSNTTQVQVRCVVRLHSGVAKEVPMVIYSDKQAPCGGVIEKSEADKSGFIRERERVMGFVSVAAIAVGLIVVGLYRYQQQATRRINDPENKQTLQTNKTNKEQQETKEPLFPQDEIRKRPSPKTNVQSPKYKLDDVKINLTEI